MPAASKFTNVTSIPIDLGATVLSSGTSISPRSLPDLRTITPVARYAVALVTMRQQLDLSASAEFSSLLEESSLTRIAGFADAWGINYFLNHGEFFEVAHLLAALLGESAIDSGAAAALYEWNNRVRGAQKLSDLHKAVELFSAAWRSLPTKLVFNLLTGQIPAGEARLPATRGSRASGRVLEVPHLLSYEIPAHLRGLPKRGFPFPKTQLRRTSERNSRSGAHWIYHTNAVSPNDSRTRLAVATTGGDVALLPERLKAAISAEGVPAILGNGSANSEFQKEYARLKEAVIAFENIHAQIIAVTRSLQGPLAHFAYHARLSTFTQTALFKYLELAAGAAFNQMQQRGWNPREVFEGFSFQIKNGYLALTDQFLEGGELLGIISLRGHSLSVYHFQN